MAAAAGAVLPTQQVAFVERWSGYALDMSGPQAADGLTLADIGRIYDQVPSNPFWYYFPSLAVNAADDMALGFSGSSVNHYIGAYYAWRPACGLGAEFPRLIHDGNIPSQDERWGDYSSTCVDPSNNLVFWTIQAYSKEFILDETETLSYWSDWISEIKPQQ